MLNQGGSESDNSGSETAGTMCGWLTRWRQGVAAEVTKGHLRGFGFCHLGDLGNDDILFDSILDKGHFSKYPTAERWDVEFNLNTMGKCEISRGEANLPSKKVLHQSLIRSTFDRPKHPLY